METIISVEEEIQKHLVRLTDARKKSILELIKLFAEKDEIVGRPQTVEEYNNEIEEAEKRIDAGLFYTQEEVEEMAKKW